MRRLSLIAISAAVATAAFVVVKIALAQLTIITPLATQSLTLTTAVTQIVAPNPTRRGLLICNGGTANDVWLTPIAPAGQTQLTPAANAFGSLVVSRTAAAAANMSCLSLPSNVLGTPIQSLVTSGFNGVSNAGTTPVTVWEF